MRVVSEQFFCRIGELITLDPRFVHVVIPVASNMRSNSRRECNVLSNSDDNKRTTPTFMQQ
jgi:hypothetical protein